MSECGLNHSPSDLGLDSHESLPSPERMSKERDRLECCRLLSGHAASRS